MKIGIILHNAILFILRKNHNSNSSLLNQHNHNIDLCHLQSALQLNNTHLNNLPSKKRSSSTIKILISDPSFFLYPSITLSKKTYLFFALSMIFVCLFSTLLNLFLPIEYSFVDLYLFPMIPIWFFLSLQYIKEIWLKKSTSEENKK